MGRPALRSSQHRRRGQPLPVPGDRSRWPDERASARARRTGWVSDPWEGRAAHAPGRSEPSCNRDAVTYDTASHRRPSSCAVVLGTVPTTRSDPGGGCQGSASPRVGERHPRIGPPVDGPTRTSARRGRDRGSRSGPRMNRRRTTLWIEGSSARSRSARCSSRPPAPRPAGRRRHPAPGRHRPPRPRGQRARQRPAEDPLGVVDDPGRRAAPHRLLGRPVRRRRIARRGLQAGRRDRARRHRRTRSRVTTSG